jgi:hypothetical protein
VAIERRRRAARKLGTGPLAAAEDGEVEAPSSGAAAATPSSSVQLTADPTGKLACDSKRASVRREKFTLRLIDRSSIPHNVTIAKGAKVLARIKTIQGATTCATANLPLATTSSSGRLTPIAKPAWRAQ